MALATDLQMIQEISHNKRKKRMLNDLIRELDKNWLDRPNFS